MPKLRRYWGIVGAAPKNAIKSSHFRRRLHGSGQICERKNFLSVQPFTRNRANSVTDCSAVYTSPYFWPGQKLFRGSPCKRKGDPFKFLAVVRTHPCKQDLDNPGITGNRLKVNAPELLRETLQLRCIPVNHNYNKILKYDWLSSVLISALKGLCNRSVRVMPK